MDTTRLAEALLDRTAAFAATVTGADPATRVPTCPDWPLRVLVGHIGQAHRWSAGIVRSGPSPVPDPLDADPGSPGNWADWLRQGAEDLAKTARDAGDTPVWTFFGEQPAKFWLRRMLNDTTVHHADAALATGTSFEVAPDLAEDVITEWLEMLANPVTASLKPAFAELRGTGQTLLLTDGDHSWLVTREPGGVSWTRDTATAATDVTLAGRTQDLLLVLTRRAPLDDVTLTGDRALAEHWLARTAA
ncbi:maleylpyruvate isomerase family mycothiol-dependent enzyme [Amycolatopsis sp. NPDC098790]|uniref:maleylpyruvate isomerase family mycothiol-dependent enzyme n=1 Tax=Amycolatopsis sp. NPDC098790 TaxID=3363939 RepID=UPI0037F68A25